MNHINVTFVHDRKKYVEEVLAHQFDLLPCLPIRVTHLVFIYERRRHHQEQRTEQIDFRNYLVDQLCLSNISLESLIPGEAKYEGTVNNMQYRLRWEEHSAFFTYTFIRFGGNDLPAIDCFQYKGITRPFPGQLLTAIDIRWESNKLPKHEIAKVLRCTPEDLYGSLVFNRFAEVWSSLKIPNIVNNMILLHDQGQISDCDCDFNRILIQCFETNNSGHDSAALGRLLDVIIELETYRTLSSYDLSESESRNILEKIEPLESSMKKRIKEISQPGGPFYYCRKLNDLTNSWAKIERLISDNTSKLAKADAYDDLVNWYLNMLDEKDIIGQQVTQIGLPMRRMIMRSKHACQTIGKRLEFLSQHIDRTSDLLRTRMDVSLQFMAVPLAILIASYYVNDLLIKFYADMQGNPITLPLLNISFKLSQLSAICVVTLFSFLYLLLPICYRSLKYPKGTLYKLLRRFRWIQHDRLP